MLVPIVAGVIVSEGICKYKKSEYCPQLIKAHSESLTESLKETHCIRIACTVIAGAYLLRYALANIEKALKGRLNLLHSPIKTASSNLGNYSRSIPFLVASVCYFSRRDALHKLGMLLFQLYQTVENVTAFLGDAALNPEETIERVGEELNREIRSLNAALRVIAGGTPPEAIQEMDGHLERFEAYCVQRQELIPRYQEKLDSSRAALNRITAEVSAYKEQFEKETKRLNQMFAELEKEDHGYLENLLKGILGVERLLEQKEDYLRQVEALHKLSVKIDMFASGIFALESIDKMECTSYGQWNVMVSQASLSLGFFEGQALFFADLPSILKKLVNTKLFGTTERCDDLYLWKRQKEVARELAPKGVALLSEAISMLDRARRRVLQALNDESEEALKKWDVWKLENLMIQKAQILFLESTMVFYQNLFPRHSVAGRIARIQSDVTVQKREHREKVEALLQADQQLVRLIEQ